MGILKGLDWNIKSKIDFKNKNLLVLIIFSLYLSIITPIVYLSSDPFLKVFIYIPLVIIIKTMSKNYGKKYGKSSIRIGKGRYLAISFVVFFSVSNVINDTVSYSYRSFLLYEFHQNLPSAKKDLKLKMGMCNFIGFLDEIMSSGVSVLINEIPDLENNSLMKIKRRISNNIRSNVIHKIKIIEELNEYREFFEESTEIKKDFIEFLISDLGSRFRNSLKSSFKFMFSLKIPLLLYYFFIICVPIRYIVLQYVNDSDEE